MLYSISQKKSKKVNKASKKVNKPSENAQNLLNTKNAPKRNFLTEKYTMKCKLSSLSSQFSFSFFLQIVEL